MGGDLEVALLGPLAVQDPSGPVPIAGLRRQALLALLALATPRPVSDDRLLEALWGDDQPVNPANALQAQVSQLRRLVGADRVVRDGNGYRLAVEADAVDVHRLERLLAAGREASAQGDHSAAASALLDAVALLRGPPLLDLLDLPFAREAASRFEDLGVEVREGWVDAELATGRHAEVVPLLTELIEAHPLRERFPAQLALALYRGGRQAEALRVLRDARTVLAEELGVDPGPELVDLERAILEHDPALRAPDGGGATLALPTAVSSFVGREAELEGLAGRLASARLITIVGAGGMGKTRLALEAARRVEDGSEVRFVELAPVTDPIAVPEAIAEALGAQALSAPDTPEAARSPVDRTADRIGRRRVLVVIDNCEHLAVAAAATITTLLEGCPGLRVLATSREALGIVGEELLPLGPMAGEDAVRLFADRARAVQVRFDPVGSEAEVADVCRRLDRMPLAIELAAARTKALPVGEIVDRLDDRFRLLRAASGREDGRATGLRAAIDWSYDSLFDDEREAFCRLAVFAGGATVEAAEAFCGPDALDLLDRLVDKSLAVADTTGRRARFGLLESLRAYGLDRLDEDGRRRQVHVDHLAWCTGLVEAAALGIRGEGQLPWLDALDAEHDNLRAALAFAATDDPVAGLRLLGPLILAWYFRGRSQEARHWIEVLLAADDGSEPRTRAKVLAWSGLVADSGTWTEEPRRIKLELLQPDSRAREAIVADAGWSDQPGHIEAELRQAVSRAREAIELLGAVEDLDLAEAHRMLVLGLVRQTTVGLSVDRDELASLVPATIDRFTQLDDAYGLAIITVLSSTIALTSGDLEGAERDRSAAEDHARRSGERFCRSRVELLSAIIAEAAGDLTGAYEHVERGLRLLSEMRMEPHVTAQAALAARLAELAGDDQNAERWRAFVADRDGAAKDPDPA